MIINIIQRNATDTARFFDPLATCVKCQSSRLRAEALATVVGRWQPLD